MNNRKYKIIAITCAVLWLIGLWLNWTSHTQSNHFSSMKRLQCMSAKEYRDFFRNHSRFYALSKDEQQRLREFHTSVVAAKNSIKLEQTLMAYRVFLASLTSAERSELQGKKHADAERIEIIHEIKKQQQKPELYADGRPPLPPFLGVRASDEELSEFLETLSPQQQYEILGMPPEKMLPFLEWEFQRERRFMRPPPFPF